MSDDPRVTVPAELVDALRARVAELEAEVERQSETLKEHTRPPRPPNFLEAEIAELRSKLNQALAKGWHEGRLATLDEFRWPGDVTLNSKANPYANVRPAAPVSEPLCRCGHPMSNHSDNGCNGVGGTGDPCFCSPLVACPKCGHALDSPDGCSECPPVPVSDEAEAGLSEDEHEAMRLTVQLVEVVCQRIIGDGESRSGDVNEFVADIHRIQNRIMAQAAGRAHPALYRLLGAGFRAARQEEA